MLSGNLSPQALEHATTVLSGITSGVTPGVDDASWARNKEDIVDAGGIAPLVRLTQAGSAVAAPQCQRASRSGLSAARY